MPTVQKVYLIPLFCFFLLTGVAQAETLKIGGTGSSGPLITKLFAEYQKQAPNVTLKLASPPLGSTGGIKALTKGRIDLAVAGRPLKAEEIPILGKSMPLARTPFVLASPDGERSQGFTFSTLAAVFDNKLTTWDSGDRIRLILRGSYDSDSITLMSMSKEMYEAVEQANRRPGMVYANNDLETVEMLVKTPGALSTTTTGLLATLDKKLTIYALNNAPPSLASLKNGAYPWYKELTIVLPQKPSSTAMDFFAFLQTDLARQVMMQYEYLPFQ